MKKYIIIGCISPFLLICSTFLFNIYAESEKIRITEVMYNAVGSDVGKEYVEIVNIGPEEINISSILFVERGRSHKVKSSVGGDILKVGDVALIVSDVNAFMENYEFDGIIIDSSNFSLNNTESAIEIKEGGSVLHRIEYSNADGANGDGNSLHISDNDSIVSKSTSIGVVNDIKIGKANKSKKTDLIDTEVEEEVVEEFSIITDPDIVFLSSETKFSLLKNETDDKLNGIWNFGDGSLIEGDEVVYVYFNPGTYIVSFENIPERRRSNKDEKFVITKEIEVIYPEVSAERVDSTFVRFTNNHSFTLDVSGWNLLSNNSIFSFPKNTLVSAKNSIVIPFQTIEGFPIFVITKGGGQFDGKGRNSAVKVEDEIKNQKQIPSPTTSKKIIKEEVKSVEEEKEIVEKPVTKKEIEVKEPLKEKIKTILIWFSLLIGIIVIAIAPFLISKEKDEK